MKTKRILTMQDLSCVGQCSLTVALPILSRYGIETCVLPTAVLSNHTMFKGWSYLDLTPEIPAIYENWKNNGIKFDAFLLGYLGKAELMALAEKCFDEFSSEGAPVIIDPVFADNGKLYGGFDLAYVAEMRKLIRRANIILPNVTEACFLTETEYREEQGDEYIKELANKLFEMTGKTVVITGVESCGYIGEYILTEIMRAKKATRKGTYVLLEKLPEKRHGTGDIFASVFTASYLGGKSLSDSCSLASRFVIDCLKNTDRAHFYGVNFEKVLSK
ncbi:MAG: pyridoxamine kinase [Clostridia bacterium]|nr:pyridoxamine kinase [Clostridia bacterium]